MELWPDEVLRAFHRSKFGRDESKSYDLIIYTPVKPIIQDGPQCGLVALVMAMNLNSLNVKVEQLFERAKQFGFTIQGELFDARNIPTLTESFNCCSNIHQWNKPSDLVDCLKENRVCLVPYDADANNEPCCKRGYRAHWLIAVGYIKEKRSLDDLSNDLVLIQQGKSRHLAAFSLNDLFDSNSQLKEVDLQRRSSSEYRMPDDGSLEKSLAHSFISIGITTDSTLLCT